MVMAQRKKEKLTQAREMRDDEVENYQINIDNYTLAIAAIDTLPDAERAEQAAFRKQLSDLLVSEKREQTKSKIMLAVLEKQLAAG